MPVCLNSDGENTMDTLLDLLNNNLMILVAGAAGALVGLLVSHSQIRKIIRMVGTSTSEIGTLPLDTQVEIVGNADGNAVVHSPITKTPCVLWQIEVQELRRSGKNSHWVTVYSDKSTAPFDVQDVSGRVLVQPGNRMELLLRTDESRSSGIFNALDEQTQAALSEAGINTKGLLNMNKRMRVYERYIEKGDQVYLLGMHVLQNGKRVMDGNMPLTISDQSELALLGKFAWQVLLTALVGGVIGVMLYTFFINR